VRCNNFAHLGGFVGMRRAANPLRWSFPRSTKPTIAGILCRRLVDAGPSIVRGKSDVTPKGRLHSRGSTNQGFVGWQMPPLNFLIAKRQARRPVTPQVMRGLTIVRCRPPGQADLPSTSDLLKRSPDLFSVTLR